MHGGTKNRIPRSHHQMSSLPHLVFPRICNVMFRARFKFTQVYPMRCFGVTSLR